MNALIVPRNDNKSANIIITTGDDAPDHVISNVPCNSHVDQTLLFIAEKAVELGHTDNISIKGYRHNDADLLTLEIKIAQKIYGDLGVTLIQEDATIQGDKIEESESTGEQPDKGIEGVTT